MSPKISVIVPIYNAERTLHRCVDSILSQTFTDFELLLIDDGSTDSSGRICDEYASVDRRIKAFHKANGGVSSARNYGMDRAAAPWLTFCDADDSVFEIWLADFAELIETGADFLCQGVRIRYIDAKPVCEESIGLDYEGSVQDLLILLHEARIMPYTTLKLFRRELLDRYGIRCREDLVWQEDKVFVTTYAIYCTKAASTSRIGYYYNAPEWGKKYRKVRNIFEVNRSILVNLFKLYTPQGDNSFIDWYIERFKLYLYDAMTGGDSSAREKMLQFRNTLGERVLDAKIFPPTKRLILWDSTAYLSTFVLSVQVRMRRIISRFVKKFFPKKQER